MAELTEIIRVSPQVKTDLRIKKKEGGHSSFDSVIRNMSIENDLLKKNLQYVTQELADYKMDLNMCILEKEQLRKELEKYKKEEQEN